MRIRFLEIAEIELDEAIQYYNYEQPGLAMIFLPKSWIVWIGLRGFQKHGIPAQRGRRGVKRAAFHMESSARSEKWKYSLLLLQTCTESQTTGRIDYRTLPNQPINRTRNHSRHHQRHPGLLQDRGREDGYGVGELVNDLDKIAGAT